MSSELKAVILEWEKLRILFNTIIGAFGAWLSWRVCEPMGGIWSYLTGAAMFGITANAFFSLGPLAEIYVGVLTSYSLKRFRFGLFALGTIFAMLVTVFVYFAFEMSLHPNSVFPKDP